MTRIRGAPERLRLLILAELFGPALVGATANSGTWAGGGRLFQKYSLQTVLEGLSEALEQEIDYLSPRPVARHVTRPSVRSLRRQIHPLHPPNRRGEYLLRYWRCQGRRQHADRKWP